MESFENFIIKASRLLDKIAGWGIVAAMLLVVVNVLLRRIFNSPILGVYEYVGFLTASVIGLALAHSSVQHAHIAIGFVLEKLPLKKQAVIDTITHVFVIIFLGISSFQLSRYATRVAISGEVSATAKMPFYPFIWLVSIGLIFLCLVELVKWFNMIRRAVEK